MSKGKIDNDEVVFRDLDGNIDEGDNDEALNRDDDSTGKEDEYEVEEEVEEDEDDGDESEEDEATDDEEESEDEQEEESLKSYSPEVRKRIERERRLSREARDSFNTEKTQLLEKIRITEAAKIESDFTSVKAIAKSCEADLAQAKRDLINAKEEGDTEKEVEAQSKFNQLQAIQSQINNESARLEAQVEANKKATPAAKPSAAGADGTLTPEARLWVDRNRDLFTKGGDKLKNFVYAIDKTIDADPNTREYFEKMNRLIKTQFPNLAPKSSSDVVAKKKGLGESKKRSKVAGVSSDSTLTGQRTNPNKVKITSDDQRIMRTFGMDPTNKAHLAQYAREKRSLSK